ncbi:hypothetical protein BH09BAC1_BH09BAC1_13960 [soil metagenome]
MPLALLSRFRAFHEHYMLSSDYLAIIRIMFALAYLLGGGMYHFEWIAQFPDLFFEPHPSLASFFNGFPSAVWFHMLSIGLIASAVALLFGLFTRTMSLLFVFLFFLGFSFVCAFGSIGFHHIIPLTVFTLSFSCWGGSFSIDAKRRQTTSLSSTHRPTSSMLGILALIISFSYLTAGLFKIGAGWFSFDSQAVQAHLISFKYSNQSSTFFSEILLTLKSKVIWEILDYLIVLMEILPFAVIFFPRLFNLSLLFLTLMHLGIYFVFGISFGSFPLLLAFLMIDWKHSPIINRLRAFMQRQFDKTWGVPVYLIMSLTVLAYLSIHYLRGYDEWINGFPVEIDWALFISAAIFFVFYIETEWLRISKREEAKKDSLTGTSAPTNNKESSSGYTTTTPLV